MWTLENRHRYDRDGLRYPSDLTDAEWALVEPLIPPAKRRRRQTQCRYARGSQRRDVCAEHRLSAALHPEGSAPRSTVNGYFCLWGWNGTPEKIRHALYVKCREQAAREASPTACIMDSQSVKSAEKGGLPSIRMAATPAS